MRWRNSQWLLILILLAALRVAAAREAAPQFTARTLGGETLTNDSLRGQVVLLQFWATWCPVCRSQQAVLENIMRDFSGEGLVVIAVDVHEDGQTVKEYLAEHPRLCHIVLTGDTDLVGEFTPKGVPFYVLIDRDGNIAYTAAGGGDAWLRSVLSRVGLGRTSANAPSSGGQRAPMPKTAQSVSPKMIEVPGGQNGATRKSLPPTVFILMNGERLESHHYTLTVGSLRITANGNQRTIPLAALDLKASVAANHDRGIELKIPTKQSEIIFGL